MEFKSKMFIRRSLTVSRSFSSARLSPGLLDHISNRDLLHTSGFINNEFVPHDKHKTFPVLNPANGEVLAQVSRMNAADVEKACVVANEAFQSWKATTATERSKYIEKMFELIEKNKEDLAKLISLESGKPLAESRGEMTYANSFYELYAEEAKRCNGEILQSPVKGRRLLTIRQPVGPAGLITPWNFPSAMITRKVGPALAAGCSVVIKPSEETPLSALALCAIAREAGLPAGVVNCLTVAREEVTEVGKALCHNPLLRKISFTGSTKVGKWLMRESADTVKRISLELGGNAPFIVFDDADLDVAANSLIFSKFRNAGQACIASNRILVQEGIYEKFAEMVTNRVKQNLVCGSGLTSGVTLGPLINAAGLEKVSRHVDDCLAKGAVVRTGGKIHRELNAKGGTFYEATVLTNISDNMAPVLEETFGPLAPLMKFKTEEEAIKIANSTRHGLAGYAFTKDLARAFRVSEALEFGMVGMNEGAISTNNIPFGGVKESGLGREGGHQGLDEYTEWKYICMGMYGHP